MLKLLENPIIALFFKPENLMKPKLPKPEPDVFWTRYNTREQHWSITQIFFKKQLLPFNLPIYSIDTKYAFRLFCKNLYLKIFIFLMDEGIFILRNLGSHVKSEWQKSPEISTMCMWDLTENWQEYLKISLTWVEWRQNYICDWSNEV